ncbi:hypothetical protein PtrSN002B_011429, partial [Pyrenophora tritici-repentis]
LSTFNPACKLVYCSCQPNHLSEQVTNDVIMDREDDKKLQDAQDQEELNQLKRKNAALEQRVKDIYNEMALLQPQMLATLADVVQNLKDIVTLIPQAGLSSVTPGPMAYVPTNFGPSHKDTVNMHPHAPRESGGYENFTAKRTYAAGTGKVFTWAYGSNEHWDLGLCHVQLNTHSVCRDKDCEWRHRYLSSGERFYISLLQPNGPNFLTWYDEATASKVLA